MNYSKSKCKFEKYFLQESNLAFNLELTKKNQNLKLLGTPKQKRREEGLEDNYFSILGKCFP
jgi:hypothetical protein